MGRGLPRARGHRPVLGPGVDPVMEWCAGRHAVTGPRRAQRADGPWTGPTPHDKVDERLLSSPPKVDLGFRLFEETPEQAAARATFEAEHIDVLYPAKRHRWHCGQCGRFVPFAGVRKIPPHGPDWVDEHEYEGTCKTHGRVDVVWGQQ
jgi:hypothetical protein